MKLSAALLFALVAASSPAQDKKAIDAMVGELMKSRGVPGLSLAIVKNGKTVYAKGYGFADVENRVKATPETVYEVGSVTKQFTSALILRLVDQGKVKLDEPMRTYLPDSPELWKGVTIRHLLTHTSGIKSYTGIDRFDGAARSEIDGPGFLKFLEGETLDFEPGAAWKYNNSGYFLLGMIIEKLTGRPYGEVLQKQIFQPLGMTHTYLNDTYTIVQNRAHGYNPDPKNGPTNAAFIDQSWPYAAGSIMSTVTDLVKWDQALYTDSPVKQSLLKQGWTPVKLNDGKSTPYGFGWDVTEVNGVQMVRHGGDIPGFNAFIVRFPTKKFSVIVLCNADPGISGPVAKKIVEMMDPSLKVEVKPVSDPKPELAKLHRGILESLAAGTLKPDLFTEQLQKAIFPDRGMGQFLASLGPIQKFILFDRKESSGNEIRQYRVELGGDALILTIVTNPEGKIGGMQIRPTDD